VAFAVNLTQRYIGVTVIVLNTNTTIAKIKELTQEVKLRPYLGMSIAGHACDRYLWYTFRWCYEEVLEERMVRLFDRGHREEPVIIDLLSRIGINVIGQQTTISTAFGHVKGHCDGIAYNVIEAPKTPHLFELKTLSEKYFKELARDRVEKAKPVYHAQMQLYMKHLKLKRSLFVGVNKNTDELYIERVYYNKDIASFLDARSEKIVLSLEPPTKTFKSTWYQCKFCSARDICHNNAQWAVNCRTCKHIGLVHDGQWACISHDMLITTSQQRIACNRYEVRA